jgi:tetraacyldisaccharide 4'-kinase
MHLEKYYFPLAYCMVSLQLFRIFFWYWCFLNPIFSVPTIVVGNLSVGGTGKSPQIEYLIVYYRLNLR